MIWTSVVSDEQTRYLEGTVQQKFPQLVHCDFFVIFIHFDSEMPNYNKLIPSILEHGLEVLPKYCHLTPGKAKMSHFTY